MRRKIITVMLVLAIVVLPLSVAAFVASSSSDTAPLADGNTADVLPSSDDAQPLGDVTTSDGSPSLDDTPQTMRLDGVTLSTTQKNYLEAHAGTYVTEKDYTSGGTKYEGSEWSIVIADDGSDITLNHNGVDTGAEVTALSGTSPITGITFSKEGEWYTDKSENQTLMFTFNSAGYITMPETTIYKVGGAEVLYRFSKTVYMYNKDKALAYFKNNAAYQGTYTLSDGSGWRVIVDENGALELTDGEGIFLERVEFGTSATSSGSTYNDVKKLVFSSANWYKIDGKTTYQTLTLVWTTLSSNKAYNHFKCNSDVTFYNADRKPIKGFNKYSYFMPADGMYSFDYFAGTNDEDGSYKYAGNYALSAAYGTVYGKDIEGIGDWYIEVAENGHVFLHAGDEKREAVATAASTGPDRITTMYVCVPDRYTDKACTIPAFIKLTWVYNSTTKAADMYFTTTVANASNSDPKVTEAYKLEGSKSVKTFIPPMHFESSKRAEFAQGKLKASANTYPYPKEALREAIYNAIVHKNYAMLIPIQISVYRDKIYIGNECVFPEDWTVENLLGKHNSRPYNPLIANTFFRAGYIESWGRGIQKIRESCKENGNEMAEYRVSPSEIMVIFHALHTQERLENTQENTQDDTQDDILTEKEKRILAICRTPKSRQEIVGLLGYKSIKSIKVEMEHLLNTNRLTMEIPDKPKSKNQKYVVVRGRIKKSL